MFQVLEEVFGTCDDVVAEHVEKLLEDAHRGDNQGGDKKLVTIKKVNLRSFTMPEFFARCSST